MTLFDPAPGAGATWAAAGMLAPLAEIAPGEKENFRLQRGALSAWRSLAADLANVNEDGFTIHETGTLLVGFDAGDRRLVDQFADVARSFGAAPRPVARGEAGKLFQDLSARVRGGLMLDGDAWLDPDDVMTALRHANDVLGVTMVRERVLDARVTDAGVEVTTDVTTRAGELGLLATGSSGVPETLRPRSVHRVRPVRGTTVRLQGLDRSALPMVRAYVRGRAVYLVSRPGGYCVLGASSDERGELGVEVGELQRLLRDALEILPALESATVLETRQGLRPASDDLSPFLEVIDGRWIWASGHYRHGVTLAPLTADAVLELAEKIA